MTDAVIDLTADQPTGDTQRERAWPVTDRLRILSIPASHPYPSAVWPDGVTVLADPTSPWWPHPALEPAWLERHRTTFDVIHLHFGYEHRTARQMTDWISSIRSISKMLILTVHDIDHPQLLDSRPHFEHLRRLLDAADAVITLTQGAANEIQCRWGRTASVIEHPPLGCPTTARPPQAQPGLLVDLRSPRPSLLHYDEIASGLEAVSELHGVDVTVLRGLGSRRRRLGRIQFEPTGPLSHARFETIIASHAIVLLPYRHGTHSGRVELCRNLGTRVLATDVGYLAEQSGDVFTLAASESELASISSLGEALDRHLTMPALSAEPPDELERRRRNIQHQHVEQLGRLLPDRPVPARPLPDHLDAACLDAV